MHGYIDNKLTKAEWITALRTREDQWASVREGQRWLADMLEYHTPDIPDDKMFLEIPEFLRLLDRLAGAYVTDRPHAKVNRHYIHSEWLQAHSGESISMAQDLAYTVARIGGADLGIAVGAHVLGGWYQLSARCDDFTREVYEPLFPHLKKFDHVTAKITCDDIVIQINLLMSGRTFVIIDRKHPQDSAQDIHIQIVGSGFAEGVMQIGLHLVDAPTLGSVLGVLDDVIAYMRQVPKDPESLRAMLKEGRLWLSGALTHA
ncbi:MAG: hypothetical protein ABIP74_03315 [Candidatus Saccharimonas sp.]